MASSSTPQPEITGNESDLEDHISEEKEKPKRRLRRKKVQKKKRTPEIKFDWPKKNYFDVKYGEIEPVKNLVHRMVYIAKLKEEDADSEQIGHYHEALKKSLENAQQYSDHVHVSITGLLLVYTKYIVHIVETTTEMLREMMRDCKKNMTSNNGIFSEVKILVISHDIPERLYQNWTYKTLEIQSARLDSYDSSESTDKIVLDCLVQLLKLGNHLSKKGNLKNSLDQLHSKVPDLLPQQAMLHFLLEEDDSCMMTVKEYLDIYEQPYDIVLDSELVWPLPTRLFPYN